jgi:hypothetical protein
MRRKQLLQRISTDGAQEELTEVDRKVLEDREGSRFYY